ncbi:hypothetical protein IX51_11740 [uncultured archaeon]|nr:hypothetical protein IX51_11740 [uncultured archaeon]
MAQTKIVATIGPSSDNASTLREMVKNGLSAVRVNTAHIKEGYITKVRKMVDSVNSDMGSNIGIMIDLKGPELRTGTFEGGRFSVEEGDTYRLVSTGGSPGDILINYPSVFRSLQKGDEIVMSDGKVKFRVLEKGSNSAELLAGSSGDLRDRSRVNIPGRYLDLGVLTERDKDFLMEGVKNSIEFYALSFVQDKSNVIHLQKLLYDNGQNASIIAKIETKSGYDNIDSISSVSDYVMVARGDLGVEMPLEEVVLAQKTIINEAHKHGVPTIVATQMLESMVESSSPTRAEVADVTNAILDNADSVMLSEETAIGKHPADAVGYLSRIADYVEGVYRDFPEPEQFFGNRIAYSIARASKIIAREIKADAILAFTLTGNTARMISAVRPEIPIYAAVADSMVGRRLNLLRGVIPISMPEEFRKTSDLIEALAFIESGDYFRKGERIVITSGAPYFLFGGTNDVRVLTVGTFNGRGYPMGPSLQGVLTKKADGKGDIVLIGDRSWDREAVASRFKGIVFTIDISDQDKEYLSQQNKTVLFNTKIVKELEEGGTVTIDGGTGIINS